MKGMFKYSDCDEELLIAVISKDVQYRWHHQGYSRRVTDDASQIRLAEGMSKLYPFPDYLELVGPPKPEHYISAGKLTILRQAELLLLGWFCWRGLVITKSDRKGEGWLVMTDESRCNELNLSSLTRFKTISTTIHRKNWMKLEEFLLAAPNPPSQGEKVIHLDANPYNDARDNLRIVNRDWKNPNKKVGRPMQCYRCKQITTTETSEVIRIFDRRVRVCSKCLTS